MGWCFSDPDEAADHTKALWLPHSSSRLGATLPPAWVAELRRPDLRRHNYMWASDADVGQLAPAPASGLLSPCVYRGQTSRYSPSVPGVFRGLAFVDQPPKLSRLERTRCLLARIRLEEFLAALSVHPAIEYSRRISLAVSPEASAQHHEILTGRLDFSQNPDVAAFFATHTRNDHEQWLPAATGTGAGILPPASRTLDRRQILPARKPAMADRVSASHGARLTQ